MHDDIKSFFSKSLRDYIEADRLNQNYCLGQGNRMLRVYYDVRHFLITINLLYTLFTSSYHKVAGGLNQDEVAEYQHVKSLLEKLAAGKITLQTFVTDLVYRIPLYSVSSKEIFHRAPGVEKSFNAAALRELHAKRFAGGIKTIMKLRFMPVLCIHVRRMLDLESQVQSHDMSPKLLDKVAKLIAAFIMGRRGNPKESNDQGKLL